LLRDEGTPRVRLAFLFQRGVVDFSGCRAIVADVGDRHHDIGEADATRLLKFLAQVLVERDLLAPLVVMTRGD
jgi:hypothetical protein